MPTTTTYDLVACSCCVTYCGCPGVPNTLTATLTSVSGCAGLGGATGTLTKTNGTIGGFTGDYWTGVIAACSGVEITLSVWCDVSTWKRLLTDNVANLCVGGAMGAQPVTSATCSPLQLQINAVSTAVGCTCCTNPGSYSITVTE